MNKNDHKFPDRLRKETVRAIADMEESANVRLREHIRQKAEELSKLTSPGKMWELHDAYIRTVPHYDEKDSDIEGLARSMDKMQVISEQVRRHMVGQTDPAPIMSLPDALREAGMQPGGSTNYIFDRSKPFGMLTHLASKTEELATRARQDGKKDDADFPFGRYAMDNRFGAITTVAHDMMLSIQQLLERAAPQQGTKGAGSISL